MSISTFWNPKKSHIPVVLSILDLQKHTHNTSVLYSSFYQYAKAKWMHQITAAKENVQYKIIWSHPNSRGHIKDLN